MTAALVALGSNLGDRRENLQRAIELLSARPQIRLVAVSSFQATRPIGGPPGQGEFLNAAALVETSLPAKELLAVLREIETSLGRKREQHWAARSLDLDLLLFGDEVMDTPELQVPHPRMQFRRFVLEPAAEVAPDLRHPKIGRTIAELRDYLRAGPNYIAITGMQCQSKTRLAVATARAVDGLFLADPSRELELWLFQDCRITFDPDTATSDPEPIELELLRPRAELVARSVASAASTPVISDFWCDECLPTDAPMELQIIAPKLLVWLDGPLESLGGIFDILAARRTTIDTTLGGVKEFREFFKLLFDESPILLKLRLDSSALPAAIDELSATIQSMRG
jgi:2-amino-4-hydroxy-6-hydroxymethyldihydropteridine diphosphokinase